MTPKPVSAKAIFYEDGYLLNCDPVPLCLTPKRFPSAIHGQDLIWNTDLNQPYIVKIPSIQEIDDIVRETQRNIIKIVWEKTIVAQYKDTNSTRGLFRYNNGFSVRCKCIAELCNLSKQDDLHTLSLKQQQDVLRNALPATLEEARARTNSNWLGGYLRLAAIAPSQNGISDPKEWIGRLFRLFEGINMNAGYIQIFLVIIKLKQRGFILAPQNSITGFSRGVGKYLMDNPEQVTSEDAFGPYLNRLETLHNRLKALLGKRYKWKLSPQGLIVGSISNAIGLRLHDLLLATNYSRIEEISWEFADAFHTPIEKRHYARWGYSKTLTQYLYNLAENNEGPKKQEKNEDPFLPAIHAAAGGLEELPQWESALSAYRETLSGIKYISAVGTKMGLFMKWIKTRPDLNDPFRVKLKDMVSSGIDPVDFTFGSYLDAQPTQAYRKNEVLAKVADFYEWFSHVNGCAVPFRYDDIKITVSRMDGRRAKTHRKRISNYVLDEMRGLLIEQTPDGYKWSNWTQSQCEIWIKNTEVFCPLLPAILFILLRWPLRGNQVQYLDSGELDSMRYDFVTKTFKQNPEGDVERRRCGCLNRSMGALQPARAQWLHAVGHQLDFQIALNKRPLGEPSEYIIPYIDPETYWVIQEVIEWQSKYGDAPVLVRESADRDLPALAQDEKTISKLPWICCLFRDPQKAGSPVGRNSMVKFWTKLCIAYDELNTRWKNPATGEIGLRPCWPKMTKTAIQQHSVRRKNKHRGEWREVKPRKYTSPIHDIHSLRVGGISHLIDRGVPLAVVGSIAGQSSMQMVLHYFVMDDVEVRKKLSEILYENPDLHLKTQQITQRLSDGDNYKDWLIGASPTAFTALLKAVHDGGTWRINATGICPGTSCSEGLAQYTGLSEVTKTGNLVPGSLCGLCSFRIYGPAFLPGLVKEFNETIYALERTVTRQRELRVLRLRAEADGLIDRATLLREEDEQLSIQSEPDCAHLGRLYEMIHECIEMLQKRENPSDTKAIALTSQQDLSKLKVEIKNVGQFEQMLEILEASELLPASHSSIPTQVNDRFQVKLLGLLAKNGVTPFLAGLPEEVAKNASLEFAKLLQRSIPNRADLESVFMGEKLFREIGFRAEAEIKDGTKRLIKTLSLGNQPNQMLLDGRPIDCA